MEAIARRRHHQLARALGGLVVVGALSLSGCQVGTGEVAGAGGKSDEQAQDAGGRSASDAGGASDGGGTGDSGSGASDGGGAGSADGSDVVADDSAPAGVDLTARGEPVATAKVPAVVEDDPDATMTVALYGLERQGDTVVATYSFTVHSKTSDGDSWIYDYLGGTGWEPYAIDTENLNKHGVLKDKDGTNEAKTDDQGQKFRPGQTMAAHAVFAAPPEDVKTMDVMLVDGAPLATEVPIR
jgi:hypothetical protein